MPEKKLYVGTRKGLFIFERNGAGYRLKRSSHLGIPVQNTLFDERTGRLWALLDHGHWGQKLSRSTDDGKTWEEIESPKYPDGEMVNDDTAATMRLIWVAATGSNDQPGRIYLGTEPGGLFRSDNDGESFELVRSLWEHPTRKGWFGGGRDQAAIHSILVDPRNHDRVLVGVSCAGVFETTDAGKTWAARNKGLRADFLPDPASEVGQDPHVVVAAKSDFDTLWQQNHCGIFVSQDGGMNWADVTTDGTANFGFAIAVHEERPQTAWVVPAVSDECRIAVDGKMVVCRTDDYGKTWTEHRKGLPQKDCYDVTFRHALDINGDELAFGTTTGNLFVSADGGESWEGQGNYLPPVYSVHFH